MRLRRRSAAGSNAGGFTCGAGKTSPTSHRRSTRPCEDGSTTTAASTSPADPASQTHRRVPRAMGHAEVQAPTRSSAHARRFLAHVARRQPALFVHWCCARYRLGMWVPLCVGIEGWGTNGEVTPGRVRRSGRRKACNEGGRVRGARGGASRVETASLSLLIARHEGGGGMRDAVVARGVAGRAMRPTRAWLRRVRRGVTARWLQSSAGRPPVRVRSCWARPAAASALRACSTRSAGRLRWQRSRIWVRVSPSGERTSAAWICSASGSPVARPSAHAAERWA